MVKTSRPEQTVSVTIDIAMPLPDGRELTYGPLTYNHDGLASQHNCDFITDPAFQAAYRLGVDSGHKFGEVALEWRAHVAVWAVGQGLALDGDFVECGVNTGILSLTAMHYHRFQDRPDRRFFLLDTFAGGPDDQLTPGERAFGWTDDSDLYEDCFATVQRNFAPFPQAVLIRGRVPDTLPRVDSEKIAYLSIDMNAVVPEQAALAHFWPRLVPGACVVLDDYGWAGCLLQKQAHDAFAAAAGTRILSLPTGQGLLVKT